MLYTLVSVQSLNRVWLFKIPWIAARQASLSFTISWSLFKQKICRPGEWNDILRTLKEKSCQSELLYPGKLPFKYEGEIKAFPDRVKLREFMTSRPAL